MSYQDYRYEENRLASNGGRGSSRVEEEKAKARANNRYSTCIRNVKLTLNVI